jgi:DMSO/TMAO reductase YedYZ molybdopterin-dependent catalytic subunit
VINGVAYVLYSLFSRHLLRDLTPTGADLRGIGASLKEHLKLRHPTGEVPAAVLQSSPTERDLVLADHRHGGPPWLTADRLGRLARGTPIRSHDSLHRRVVAVCVRRRARVRGHHQRLLEPFAIDDHRLLPDRCRQDRDRVMTSRRNFLVRSVGALGAAALAGCDRLSESEWFTKVLRSNRGLNRGVQKALGKRPSMAQEFGEKELSPYFRSNGTDMPGSPVYAEHARRGFADWTLRVTGLVENPSEFRMARLRAMPSRTQITRHDCVEGWSAIGKWTGVPLAELLKIVRPKPSVRYAVFHCADAMSDTDPPEYYYESIDMDDVYHLQTILAYGLNGRELPIQNGAPLRLRVERQLGYKHAKYVHTIELVETFAHIGRGNGGYWEDYGYQWYAGI